LVKFFPEQSAGAVNVKHNQIFADFQKNFDMLCLSPATSRALGDLSKYSRGFEELTRSYLKEETGRLDEHHLAVGHLHQCLIFGGERQD
jgi:hypothetical protein